MKKIIFLILSFSYKYLPLPNKIKVFVRHRLSLKKFFRKTKVLGIDSYSQASQDVFVLKMLHCKRSGVYVEIGANDPITASNTFTLEKNYGWSGVSFEMIEEFVTAFKTQRRNPCVLGDAVGFGYREYFISKNFPFQIDYLQVDIDPSSNSLAVLKNLPLDEFRFSVITFEHDRYNSGDSVMNESRSILLNHGYKLVAPNVLINGQDFEDWWIDPRCIESPVLTEEPLQHHDIIIALK